MYPNIPFSTVRDRAIDLDGLQGLATQRYLAPTLPPLRDDAGKFVSASDTPDKNA